MNALNKIVLIGVGLIGGSLMLDLKRQQKVQTVVGIDTNADNLARAIERRVIDEAHTEISAQAIAHADLVILATPVATFATLCRLLAPHLSPNTVISDVGSTKQSTLAAFAQYLPQHLPRCVAAHPIAGSDRSGALAAQFGLYQHKKLILCPHDSQDPSSLHLVAQMWQSVGAQIHQMSATEHDAIFAAVSHFPHLLAFSYVHQMLDHPQGARYLDFAGSGFRDFTRIAGSHPNMWRDIMLANRDSLLALIDAQQAQLAYLRACLQQADAQKLGDYLAQASQLREDWGKK